MKDVWHLFKVVSSLEAYWWAWNNGKDLNQELIGAVYRVFYWGRMNAEASDSRKPWANVERNIYSFRMNQRKRWMPPSHVSCKCDISNSKSFAAKYFEQHKESKQWKNLSKGEKQ